MSEPRIRAVEERLDKIERKLDTLVEAHNKQRGFIAGFSAAFSMLFAMIVGLVIYAWKQVTGS